MKHAAIPIAVTVIAVLATAAITAFVLKGNSTLNLSPSSLPSPSQTGSTSNTKDTAKLSLSDNYELVLESPGQTLSGVALRLTINLNSVPKAAPKLEISSTLAEQNWSYPIHEISLNAKTLTIDLAALNISPEGFPVQDPITLATLKFVDSIGFVNYSFSRDLTKVIAKNGEELMIFNP